MKQLTVLIPNRPGAFCEVADVLAADEVNIDAYHLANSGRGGFVQLICTPHELARSVLARAYQFYVIETEVLALRLKDEPGRFLAALNLLRVNNLNILNSYLTFDSGGNPVTVIEFEDPAEVELATALFSSDPDIAVMEVIRV